MSISALPTNPKPLNIPSQQREATNLKRALAALFKKPKRKDG